MKNMNNKTKKWLTVAGCLVVCAVLVGLIGNQFKTEPLTDEPLPSQSSQPSDVTVNTPNAEKEKEPVVIPPEIPKEKPSTDNGAVSSGTEQTIQPDPVKPEYTEDQLKDEAKTPDGKPVTTPPPVVDHDKVEPPKEVPTTPAPSKPSGGNSIPGFDDVPDGGANQGEYVDDMYENGNKVGIMD